MRDLHACKAQNLKKVPYQPQWREERPGNKSISGVVALRWYHQKKKNVLQSRQQSSDFTARAPRSSNLFFNISDITKGIRPPPWWSRTTAPISSTSKSSSSQQPPRKRIARPPISSQARIAEALASQPLPETAFPRTPTKTTNRLSPAAQQRSTSSAFRLVLPQRDVEMRRPSGPSEDYYWTQLREAKEQNATLKQNYELELGQLLQEKEKTELNFDLLQQKEQALQDVLRKKEEALRKKEEALRKQNQEIQLLKQNLAERALLNMK